MQLQENGSLQNPTATKNNLHTANVEKPPKLDDLDQIKEQTFPADLLKQSKSSKLTWIEICIEVLKFIAPLTISIAVFWLSVQQNKTSDDNQKQQVMSDYFEQMTDLILDSKKYGEFKGKENSLARSIARAKTLSTLRQLDGVRKGQVLKFLYEADLVGSCTVDLTKLQLGDCKERHLDLKEAKLDEATFEQLNLQKISLAGINLEGASLAYAQLPEIGLAGANMTGVKLYGANLTKAHLAGVHMSGAILEKAQFIDVKLQDADLRGAKLTDANLRGANLQNANLSKAVLRNAILDNADLQGANLSDVDLRGASLEGVNLKEAIYNDKTEFGSFNPEGEGMTKQN